MTDETETRFFRIGNAVVTSELIKTMTAVDLKVYLALAQHASWRTGFCHPSVRRLHDLTGASLTSIAKAVRRLVGFGLIRAERNGKRFTGLDPRKMVYQVFRIPQASPEDRSSGKEKSTAKRKRDESGKYCSSRKEPYCSIRKDTSCSSDKEHNKNYEQKELNKTPLLSPRGGNGDGTTTPSPAAGKIISDQIIQEFVKARGKPYVLNMLRAGGYVVPPSLLPEGEPR